jgi:methylmalonyl-CoA/ethylmalonyl-CoA epimerase
MLKLECHHIGIATKNLEREILYYETLNYKIEGEIFEDPIQKVRGVFMVNNGMRIELLQSISESSPLLNYLKKGIQMYHQGFVVEQINDMIKQLIRDGAILVSPPQKAVAFNGRRIAFLYMQNRMLIELIEKPSGNKSRTKIE